ncbi:hypothetical protein [Prauserella flavalba]|uniref:hypothetical protein n=1 Tax=Prauserella flavalba TaxID=1477506 RepID=UPI0036E8DFF5
MREPGEAVMVVRLRRGVVGETRRVCHLVPAPAPGTPPRELAALCGEGIVPGQAELLSGFTGMPCEACLAVSARNLPPGLIRAS